MLPATGPDAFAISFTWTTAEYQEFARVGLERKLLVRVTRPASAGLALAALAALPISQALGHISWSVAIADTAPWIVLFGFWWLLASQAWRLPPSIRGQAWNEVPEDRAVSSEDLVADGGFSSARLRWRDIDLVRETPLLLVIGSGQDLVAIPHRVLTAPQRAQIEQLLHGARPVAMGPATRGGRA